jgi:protein ImuB
VIPYDPARDRAAMQKLAEWACRYSPIVGVDGCSVEHPCPQTSTPAERRDFCPDGLVLDISGCERAFKGEERLAFLIATDLRRMGFECRVGIGPSIGAAWAASRYGSTEAGSSFLSIVRSYRELAGILGPLPVRGLRLDSATCEGLHELGIDRIDQLMALPRRQIPSRFGDLITRRIDQALGQAIETITPVRPRPPLRVEQVFDGPTTQTETLEICSRELLGELCREMLTRESGVRLLEVVFDRVKRDARGTEPVVERITLSRPTRNARHLWSLLRPRLDRLHLGNGIDGVSLVAVRTATLRHSQKDLAEERHQGIGASRRRSQAEHGGGTDELFDVLVNRLGADRVLRPERVESHLPERSFRMVALAEPSPRPRKLPEAPPRPSTLFEKAEAAEAVALMPDRPPSMVRWRGREHRITLGIGPERIGAEWWRWHEEDRHEGTQARRHEGASHPSAADLSPRDYFRVRGQDGQWLWVYRELYTSRWFVHGVWG